MATDAMVNPEQLLNETLDRINKNRGGAFQENAVTQAIKEYQNLDNLVKQGSISQKDYVGISDAIKGIVVPIGAQSTQGRNPAQSLTNAGWYQIQDNFRNADIYKNASELLGRDITPTEFAQIAPRFGTGSPRDVEVGRAYLAELATQDAKSPKALQQKAGQYGGDVNTIFNDLLKRGASQDEINHFGSLLASGDVDAYTLRQFVSQLPEYTEARSAEAAAKQAEEDRLAREKLGTELQGYDQDFFNKAQENVISRYSKAGIQNSPSLDFALTNLMGDIQKERSAYLSDIARRDYESARGYKRDDLLANRGMAREDYLTNLDRMFGQSDYGRQRSDAYSDLLTNRSFGSMDYQRQQDDLLRLLSNQGGTNRNNAFGSMLSGGLSGAGAFASTKNPYAIAGGGLLGMMSGYLDR
jgi:hypothetical protein